MVSLYCQLIIAGRRTYESVPENLKTQVADELRKLGYDTSGRKPNEVL